MLRRKCESNFNSSGKVDKIESEQIKECFEKPISPKTEKSEENVGRH